MSCDFIPCSKEEKKDDEHVVLLCKALLHNRKIYSGSNPYAPRQSIFSCEVEIENKDTGNREILKDYITVGQYSWGLNSKELFKPTDAEIKAALEEFRKKGWHAIYDSDCGYWEVYQGTIALGEYQARFTQQLF